ncbi:thiamine pyrophosphate-dependent enzyme [Pseudolysinimonas sp.]|jgi:2-oxoisovalerate dehydrogenase E1 component|uniref:thiamine pyrophosphate-dependent enzyme n=1 Tax=Pseudolysinimonas sp. TaxID=2680009 RepID=UPI0037852CC6
MTTQPLDQAFLDAIPALRVEAGAGGGLDPARLLAIFEAQLVSRHADLAARTLGAAGQGFYTIGSAGHEGNAAIAAALRPTDPALLHYRSGAFYAARAQQVAGVDALRDILLGVVAAVDDPISGGRHKVFGHRGLAIIPKTSTIASHLPRALGIALAIPHAAKLGVASAWPRDAISVASFGDASVNHSTAVGAINSALQMSYRGVPLPLLLICEDNGIGISTPTPDGWVERMYAGRPGLDYVHVDGGDAEAVVEATREVASRVRERRRPAFLHVETVRYLGHAGADVESAYRSPAAIAADLARDPLLRTAARLVARRILAPTDVLARYEAVRARAAAVSAEVVGLPKLTDGAVVEAPLRVSPSERTRAHATTPAASEVRLAAHGGVLPEHEAPLTLAQAINRALADVLAADPGAILFGEDVARKGGVYGVTRGLMKRIGRARVFDTLLDEQTILGLALGAGISGLLPIPEIQYLAYLHNAEDQLRGEAASQAFFSDGRYRNPLVVRIAGYGYQKGFGGHFHNDNSVAVLRDIPGLVIASPSSPSDAAAMLRGCAALARTEGAVCAFLEPIALYHTRDLHDGDDGWVEPYPSAEHWIEPGSARIHGDGGDLTIVTFANGVRLSRRAARRLEERGIRCRVVDLRWLAPLPVEDVLREAAATGRLLVVDETRSTGGVGEALVTAAVLGGFRGHIARVAGRDSFIPLGPAAQAVLVSEDDIVAAGEELARR